MIYLITYREAQENDINLLMLLRLKFLEAVPSDTCYPELKENVESYFKAKISNGECVVILAENDVNSIGTGIMFYYDSVPSASNITGKSAYITCMYVDEPYRRQNIGSTILTKLIETAKENKCYNIKLSATDIGKKLYEKHGFVDIKNGMKLKY